MPRHFSLRAPTDKQAKQLIQEKYGDRAVVMTYRNVPARGLRGLLGHSDVEYSGTVAVGDAEIRKVEEQRDLENRKAILASLGKSMPAQERVVPEDTPLARVLEELQSLKSQIVNSPASIPVSDPPSPPRFPLLQELQEILEDNDFSPNYIRNLLNHIQKEFTVADLDDRNKIHETAVAFVARSIPCKAPVTHNRHEDGKPRIVILVGPTGVGKTTTIAKLAAVNSLSRHADVRIFTIDGFRIGAFAQIKMYGEIMEIPVLSIEDAEDLAAQLALASEADLILIDTIGKSPKEKKRIEQMRQLLTVCGKDAEVHLTVSATTKTGDLRKIMSLFNVFNYQSIIFTKLDETMQVGNLISVLTENVYPVSYFTDGQSVPVDIALASPGRLLSRLNGLDYDELTFSEQYPSVDITASWR